MNNNNPKHSSQTIARLVATIMPIQILTLATSCFNSIIDGAVGSNFIGEEAMTAIGIYTPLQLICAAFNLILLGGSQVLCGRYIGEGRMEGTKSVFSINMTLVVIFTGLITVLSFVMPYQMALALGAAESADGVAMYIIGRGVGVIPLLMAQQYASFLQIERQDKRNYVALVSMLGSNIVLDLLFAAVLKMGLLGLGIATSLSNWVFCFIVGSYFFTKKAMLKFSLKSANWKDLGPLFNIGFPGATLILCTAVRSVIINRSLARYAGMAAVAALATQTLIHTLYSSVPTGIAGTMRMIGSVSYGEEDRASLLTLLKIIIKRSFIVVGIEAVLSFVIAVPIARFYYHDTSSEIYGMVVTGLRACAIYLIPLAVTLIFSYYYQATGKNALSNFFSFLQGFLLVTVIAVPLMPSMGIDAVWLAMIGNSLITCVIIVIVTIAHNKRFVKNAEDWLILPSGYGVSEEDRLVLILHDKDSIASTFDKVADFCKRYGVDEEKVTGLTGALASLAGNIIRESFDEAKDKNSIDISLFHKDNVLTIRLKGDNLSYSAENREESVKRVDMMTHFKKFRENSSSVEYSNMLGLNVLTIKYDLDNAVSAGANA